MPIDAPEPAPESVRPDWSRTNWRNPGSIWLAVRWRVTSWFRPRHPRFALHLFLLTLAVGLLLGLASLAMTGIVELSRRGPTTPGAQATGPGGPLPRPMAVGNAALAAAGEQRPSSMMIEETEQAPADPSTDSTVEVDPGVAGISIGTDSPLNPTAVSTEGAVTPQQDAALDQAPPVPAVVESARSGPQVEVVLSVQIDAQGNPVQVSVQRSSGSPAIDNAAMLEVRNQHFPPTLRDGEPVPATLEVPVRLPLQDH